MRIYDVIWKERFVDKIEDKHGLTMDEVEHVRFSEPHTRLAERGHIKGEDLYAAYGQTDAGRYVFILYVRKRRTAAMPITARDMTKAERRYYDDKKKAR